MTPTFFGHNSTGTGTGGGGGGTASAFSDDFNRANSTNLGADWTEVTGALSINTNTLLFQSGSFSSNMAMWNTACAGLTQYQKFEIHGAGVINFGLLFRAVSNTGAGYSISFAAADNDVLWQRFSNIATGAGAETINTAQPITVDANDIIGVTVDGLGNNTVVRIWRNPTGLPVSAANWNGDTTPNISFTNNPVTPADTGLRIGVWASMEDPNSFWIENWFGGSL